MTYDDKSYFDLCQLNLNTLRSFMKNSAGKKLGDTAS